VRLSAWRAFLPDSSQPVLREGDGRCRGVLELQPSRAEPDDRHVAVAPDRGARRLANRAQAVGDRDPRGNLETLAGARAVGEPVLERLLEPAQVVGLTERKLGLGAAQLDLIALRARALGGAQILAGPGAGTDVRRAR
jgi:hypothetical protein